MKGRVLALRLFCESYLSRSQRSMIAAKPCFPRAHTGVLATHRVCHGPAQVLGKPPETDVYGLDTHLCRKPSWEVPSHSGCYRGHIKGQERCLWGGRDAACPTMLPDGSNYLTDMRTEVWKVQEAWRAQCEGLSISTPLPSPPLPDSRGCLNAGEA